MKTAEEQLWHDQASSQRSAFRVRQSYRQFVWYCLLHWLGLVSLSSHFLRFFFYIRIYKECIKLNYALRESGIEVMKA